MTGFVYPHIENSVMPINDACMRIPLTVTHNDFCNKKRRNGAELKPGR